MAKKTVRRDKYSEQYINRMRERWASNLKKFTRARWMEFLDHVRSGLTPKQICDKYPKLFDYEVIRRLLWSTHIVTWATKDKLTSDYRAAKDIGADARAEMVVDESMDRSRDALINPDGSILLNHAAVSRSKVVTDNLKWAAKVAAPRRYGDKVDIQTNIGTFSNLDLSKLTDQEFDQFSKLMEKARREDDQA